MALYGKMKDAYVSNNMKYHTEFNYTCTLKRWGNIIGHSIKIKSRAAICSLCSFYNKIFRNINVISSAITK